MIDHTVLIAILLFLTLCSAFFSGSEAALFSLSSLKVKTYRTDPDPRKRLIADLLRVPRDLLVTVFMFNTLVNILLQNVASHMFGISASWWLKVGVPLALTLILGEVIPKIICMQNNTRIAYSIVPLIDFLHRAIAPLRQLTLSITFPISRIMFFHLKKEESITREELKHVLTTSEMYGVLHAEESRLVWGYLKYQEATVREIMVPKEDILYYNISEPLSKLTYLFVEKECSRVPVCRESVDNVLGVLRAKRYFLHAQIIQVPKDITHLLDKPLYVPETITAPTLLKRFEETGQTFAVVVDEYGSISGVVTYEDIAEVIIGDIADRRDRKPLFSEAGKNEIIASGKLELDEFNRIFNVDLTSPGNMVTIGGWLIEQIGEIPKGGTTLETENFFFQILASDPNRIRRVYIRKLNHKTGKEHP